jgi:hypothetical protein
MKVLWLDDDTAAETVVMDDVQITKVQNCEQASQQLQASLPDWVLVDFIVPQENWGEGLLYRVPGLKFIDVVCNQYKERIRVAAYGRGVSPNWREVAHKNGAERVYEKRTIAFHDVIQELRSLKEQM